MAEHDDVPDLEHLNCEFERREHPVTDAVGRVCGYQVGNIAHHEQLARMRVENHLRRDPRIATADDHDGRGLAASCELAIALALRRHATSEEITIAFDEPGRKFRRHRWPGAHYIINARSPNRTSSICQSGDGAPQPFFQQSSDFTSTKGQR
jgi:hypothetical protein